jgi:hypothetical protein
VAVLAVAEALAATILTISAIGAGPDQPIKVGISLKGF